MTTKNSIKKLIGSSLIIAFIIGVVTFVKVIIFHLYLYNGLIISSLWNNPPAFWSFWLPKIAVSVLFAALVLLIKNKKWLIPVCLFLDVWIEANLVYFRCNHLFIDYYALTMAGNMDGLWNSTVVFMQWKDSVFLILTILLSIVLWRAPLSNKRSWKPTTIAILISIGLQVVGNYSHHVAIPDMPFVPFQITQSQRFAAWCHEVIPVKENSVFHVLLWDMADFCTIGHDNYTMTEDDKASVQPFIQRTNNPIALPNQQCIIIVVESMESWVVCPEFMPNLYAFTQSDHTLYCPHVQSQIKQGISSDGQLIVNTGLLPIQRGAWSFLYSDNMYPSITSLYQGKGVSLDPSDGKLWNKHNYIQSWGIGEDIQTEEIDSMLFKQVIDKVVDDCPCIWTITMSTHAPFEFYELDDKRVDNKMPELMKHYTHSFTEVDKALGKLFDFLSQGNYLDNRILVVTGDHTILPPDNREDFRRFCKDANVDYSNINEYVPLVIYSPAMQRTLVEDVCYQMDIYPTILSLIGCENYWWKGFGVNLLDSTARSNRPISESEAYELSDKIIRSDYFRLLFSK